MPLHILLAENDSREAKRIAATLASADHTVDAVADGLATVEAARDTAYDIILMGTLSGFDGVGATRLIRGLGGANRIVPILSIGARAEPTAGLDGHLSKGFDASDIQRRFAAHNDSMLAAEAA
jgi:CheY-like chemotaxis protein